MKSESKDALAGALMTSIGLAAAMGGLRYDMGTLAQMGAGFFPVVLGSLLAALGVLIAWPALRVPGAARNRTEGNRTEGDHAARSARTAQADRLEVETFTRVPASPGRLRPAASVILGIVAFQVLGPHFGLVPASVGIVLVCALGRADNTVLQALLLSLGMAGIAIVVFHWGLQLQMPLFAWPF